MNAYIVDRSALAGNIQTLKAFAGDSKVYGVIKGDGYGLGLLRMASILQENGVNAFAVTDLREVQALRQHGFSASEILMLRATCLPDELQELLSLDAIATVGSAECAEVMAQVSAAAGKPFRCHVKVDTGMGRYGFLPDEVDAMAAVYRKPELSVEGIYTHFHSAFGNDTATRNQFNAFLGVCNALKDKGIQPGIRHCANSSAFLLYPDMHLDAVRLGSALLGRVSCSSSLKLERIGWCQSQIELLRTIPKGATVGYGAGWTAHRETRLAICGVGYFLGFGSEHAEDIFRFRDCLRCELDYVRAFLRKRAYHVSVNGKQAKVLGHIGMVQTVFDVTDIPCKVGDSVRLEINPLMVKGLPVSEIN